MHKFIKKIKNNEEKPYVIKNFLNSNEIREFIDLYQKLPVKVNNQRQKIPNPVDIDMSYVFQKLEPANIIRVFRAILNNEQILITPMNLLRTKLIKNNQI